MDVVWLSVLPATMLLAFAIDQHVRGVAAPGGWWGERTVRAVLEVVALWAFVAVYVV
jgi:hypothetical protein